jgi:hypothetical protein
MKRKNESEESSPKKVKKKNELNTMEQLKNHSKESVQQVLDKKKKKIEIEMEQEEEKFDSISDEDVFEEISSEPEDSELVIDMEETPKTPKSKNKKSSNSSTPRKTKVGEFSIVFIYKLNLIRELKKLEKLHHEIENETLKVISIFNFIPREFYCPLFH